MTCESQARQVHALVILLVSGTVVEVDTTSHTLACPITAVSEIHATYFTLRLLCESMFVSGRIVL